MTQTSVLAPGVSALPSGNIVVPAGSSVTVGIYSEAPGVLPARVVFGVMQDTPGADNYIASLRNDARTTLLVGPGTYRVNRPAYTGTAFGVFIEE